MSNQVMSKEGSPIHEGDHVVTKIRGGVHEGEVNSGQISKASGWLTYS